MGATLNDQPLSVEAGGGPGQWTFAANLQLGRGVSTDVTIRAFDRGGNIAQHSGTLLLLAQVSLALRTPAEGAYIDANGSTGDVPVEAQVVGTGPGDVVRATVGAQTVVLTGSGDVYSGVLSGLATESDHTVVVEVMSVADAVLGQATATFRLRDVAQIPLELVATRPANGGTGVETNEPITFELNRPAAASDLQIIVRETAHGYALRAPPRADLRTASRVDEVRYDRDQEVVPGRSQNLPGNRAYVFYPARDYGYAGLIEVEVRENGVSVGRSRFTVRSAPNLVHGFVVDDDGTPLEGVVVRIDKLGHEATTDADGSFGFGWGWDAGRQLPAGQYRVSYNPGRAPRGSLAGRAMADRRARQGQRPRVREACEARGSCA